MRHLIKSGIRRLARPQTTPQNNHPLGKHNAVVISVAAQKGGVGKTTTSVSMAAGLARFHNKKVLLIDLDPQGHVNTALKSQVRAGGGSISEILTHERGGREVMEVVTKTHIEGLWVTPLDNRLAVTEDLMGTRIGKEFILRDALQATRTHYDVIVIDCPPNLGNLTLNGLVAADQVLIPCDPSPLSLNGVHALVDAITTVATRLNPDIDLLGLLLTRVDGRNTTLNASVIESIENTYEEALLPTQIGISSSLAKAQMEGFDIFDYDPKSRGAVQYRELSNLVAEYIDSSGS